MIFKTFQIWMLLVVLGFLACAPAFIDQPERIYIKTNTPVRAGPGINYDVITHVKAGIELFLLESKNDWHRVELPNGKTGWIYRGITHSVAREKIVTIRDAKVHRGPGEEYGAFALVKKGRTLYSRGTRGNWFLVDLTDGKSGWVSRRDAEKTSYRNLTVTKTAQIFRFPDSKSEPLITVNSGTELIQYKKDGKFYNVRLPNGGSGWIHESNVGIIKERTVRVKSRTYIRTGPGIGYDVIETVEEGARLTRLTQKDNWFNVLTPQGRKGWIYKDFIATTSTSKGTIIEEQAVYVVTNQDCNIRQGYGTDWEKIARLKQGTLLIKIGQRDNWLRIKMSNERIGWIRDDLVSYDPNILLTNLECNIRRGYGTDYIVIRRVPAGTPLVKISEKSGWSRVYLVDGEIGWIRNDLFTPLDSLLFVSHEFCNVRDGASTNHKKIAELDYGTPVKSIGRESNWYKIKLLELNKTGYIRGDLLSKTGNELKTNKRCVILQGPSSSYRIKKNVPKNTRLNKIGEENGWFRVRYDEEQIGWIEADLVSPSYYPVPGYRATTFSGLTNGSSIQSGTGFTSSGSGTSADTQKLLDVDGGVFEAQGQTAVTEIAINFRTAPDLNASVIKQLPPGSKLKQIDKAGDWVEVISDEGTNGWVHQSAFGIEETKYLYVNKWANVRLGPSINYKIIDKVSKGVDLIRLEKRDNWYHVKIPNGKKGWIREDLLTVKKIMPPIDPNIKSKPIFALAETMMETEMYKGPSTAYPIIKNLPPKTNLTIISEYEGWSEIKLYNGLDGWVNNKKIQKKFHSKVIAIKDAEVHKTSNSQSDLVTTVNKGDRFRPINEKDGWYRIYLGQEKAGWVSAGDVKIIKYPAVFVKTEFANIRRLPDEDSGKIAIIKEGVKLTPLDEFKRETDKFSWLFVKLPRGDKGWIRQDLVNRQKHPWILVKRDAEVYEEPTAGSLSKGSVKRDEKFIALDKNDNWYKIPTRGSKVAWIYAGYVEEQIIGTQLVKENSGLRMGPGLDYRIIKTVSKSEQAKWLDEKGDWRQIQISGGEVGWISVGQTKSVPMTTVTAQQITYAYDKPNSNSQVVGKIFNGRKYTPLEKKNNWYRIQLTDGKFGWVEVNAFTSPKHRTVFTLEVAKIYKGPSVNNKILQTVEPATDLDIIGSDGGFYWVELKGGIRGYVKKELVFE
ncbi:SH3 domain-containing protein [candidate division KSB1 bacterium]|nr:SH3 domain-containing protein [candidate division KSB1 bacterium]MBL7093166.1 SH3 domain-containing protein [candidate division KSB1 bacterium]